MQNIGQIVVVQKKELTHNLANIIKSLKANIKISNLQNTNKKSR